MRAKEAGVPTTGSHLSPAENYCQGINFQASPARILEPYLQYWGRAYTKKILVAYLKFKFNWASCILSGSPRPTPWAPFAGWSTSSSRRGPPASQLLAEGRDEQ